MATADPSGSAARGGRRLLAIAWFTGAVVLLYLIGETYKIPAELVSWHHYVLGLAMAGLTACLIGSLVWARVQIIRQHFTKKSVKALDSAGKGIERLKAWLSPHKPGDSPHDPSARS
ncbi:MULTISPECIES: hypothetical protein [Streptomyces]|uniref:hypothetical protein n=1 Tax=Streptomyces TaxID=1883 RepID=UPI002E11FFCE|nr:hypothetical protein OG265_37215 [Streptomyces sp. NBC_01208]